MGAVWGRKPSSVSICCVWETYLRLPASRGCEIIETVYLARRKGEGKGFFAPVPMSSAHTSTSWDCIWTELEPCSLWVCLLWANNDFLFLRRRSKASQGFSARQKFLPSDRNACGVNRTETQGWGSPTEQPPKVELGFEKQAGQFSFLKLPHFNWIPRALSRIPRPLPTHTLHLCWHSPWVPDVGIILLTPVPLGSSSYPLGSLTFSLSKNRTDLILQSPINGPIRHSILFISSTQTSLLTGSHPRLLLWSSCLRCLPLNPVH